MSRHTRAMLLALQHRQNMIERLQEAIDTGLTPAEVEAAGHESVVAAAQAMTAWKRADVRKRELEVRQAYQEESSG